MATEERLRGHHAALATAGVLPDPALVVESNFEVEGGRVAAAALLDLAEPPTAIFAFNDQLAIGAMQAVLERVAERPGTLSIVGFDDTPRPRSSPHALTTVHQPLAEIGRMGVSLLTRQLENQRLDALHVELETKLVVRGSTAAPRDGK